MCFNKCNCFLNNCTRLVKYWSRDVPRFFEPNQSGSLRDTENITPRSNPIHLWNCILIISSVILKCSYTLN